MFSWLIIARSYTKFCMISMAPYCGQTLITLVGKPGYLITRVCTLSLFFLTLLKLLIRLSSNKNFCKFEHILRNFYFLKFIQNIVDAISATLSKVLYSILRTHMSKFKSYTFNHILFRGSPSSHNLF